MKYFFNLRYFQLNLLSCRFFLILNNPAISTYRIHELSPIFMMYTPRISGRKYVKIWWHNKIKISRWRDSINEFTTETHLHERCRENCFTALLKFYFSSTRDVHIWPIIARSVPFPSLPRSPRLPWLHYCLARRHFNSSNNLNFIHSDICRWVRRYLNSLTNLHPLMATSSRNDATSRQKDFLDFSTATSY